MHKHDDMTPYEMAEVLQEFTLKIENDPDLHPKDYLDKDVEALYTTAHKYYAVDCYEDALVLFTRLVLARSTNIEFWKALASTQQMLKKYKEALLSWGMAAVLNPNDLSNHIFAAECLINLDEIIEAKKALDHVERLIDESDSNFKKYSKIKLLISGATLGDR